MAARKTTKARPKVRKIKKVVANQVIAEIDAMLKAQKKLDLELKKIQKNVRALLGHQYFA